MKNEIVLLKVTVRTFPTAERKILSGSNWYFKKEV